MVFIIEVLKLISSDIFIYIWVTEKPIYRYIFGSCFHIEFSILFII